MLFAVNGSGKFTQIHIGIRIFVGAQIKAEKIVSMFVPSKNSIGHSCGVWPWRWLRIGTHKYAYFYLLSAARYCRQCSYSCILHHCFPTNLMISLQNKASTSLEVSLNLTFLTASILFTIGVRCTDIWQWHHILPRIRTASFFSVNKHLE